MTTSTSLLTFSSLYPNSSQPGYGLFVEARLRNLMAGRAYQSRVVSPVPWFPLRAPIFGKYAVQASVPHYEKRYAIPVWHPRYLLLPKIGMNHAPSSLWRAALRTQSDWMGDGYTPQLIDAHYFYPDGVAAAQLAKTLKLPLMITARGSDINLISEYSRPLRMMREAAAQSQAIVAVSSALAEKMCDLGFAADKIHVLRNGVDLNIFRPMAREEIREQQGLQGRVLLSVGNLIELKGHDICIKALAEIPDTTLLIAGSGPQLSNLQNLATQCGVQKRVRFLGQTAQGDLCKLYNAADVLLLASSREGLANVLLEAVASGTPAVATNVGGNPEVICDPRAGELMEERSPQALIGALLRLESRQCSRDETRDFAKRFGWADTCHKLDQLIQRII